VRARLALRLVKAGLLPGLLGACYTYSPSLVTPLPSAQIAVVLSDFGRSEASPQIGPQAARLEGAVVTASDSGYLVAVSGVKAIAGSWVRWTGETVSLRRDYVAFMYERRFSKSRTALFAAGVAGALGVAVFGLDLFGIGADRLENVPNAGGDPGDQ